MNDPRYATTENWTLHALNMRLVCIIRSSYLSWPLAMHMQVQSSIPYGEKPSCLHTTLASLLSQASLHIVVHVELMQTSTRPTPLVDPPSRRTSLSSQGSDTNAQETVKKPQRAYYYASHYPKKTKFVLSILTLGLQLNLQCIHALECTPGLKSI